MAVKIADTIKPMADFPAAESTDLDITLKSGVHKSIQKAYEDGDLGGGGSDFQFNVMPIASDEYVDKIIQYIGEDGTYLKGAFYAVSGSNAFCYSNEGKNLYVNKKSGTPEIYAPTSGTSAASLDELSVIQDVAEYADYTFVSISEDSLKMVDSDGAETVFTRASDGDIGDGSYVWIQAPEVEHIQYKIMPAAGAEWDRKVIQYIGESDSTYKKGNFYTCQIPDTPLYYCYTNGTKYLYVTPDELVDGDDKVLQAMYKSGYGRIADIYEIQKFLVSSSISAGVEYKNEDAIYIIAEESLYSRLVEGDIYDLYKWIAISSSTDVDEKTIVTNETTKKLEVSSNYKTTFQGTMKEWEELSESRKKGYDIVNLEDDLISGELIVVDEIEEGNLNPVTSNAVAIAIGGSSHGEYSSEEVATGKKWIDGSTIYRKVITYTGSLGNGTTIAHGIANLSKLIDIRFMFNDTDQNEFQCGSNIIMARNSSTVVNGITVNATSIVIGGSNIWASSTGRSWNFILEYIKG